MDALVRSFGDLLGVEQPAEGGGGKGQAREGPHSWHAAPQLNASLTSVASNTATIEHVSPSSGPSVSAIDWRGGGQTSPSGRGRRLAPLL
eukprot:CAMPEP_0206224558 /NCGR_PEP_ID=MMETSP0047_2-20121206/7090_1 /ASSEMBLY_ACC=CAM_ASM_000192 /TAXON_ID=195065 /ORGANISM="Chroomonas mesostigmatica_cf, Strain CCMP1168" /LENGTH=89 /DNA_ID=CAMNT_0053647523 /DNA_START=107 /DNA_END=372 /DNA_ORIENTATION=-